MFLPACAHQRFFADFSLSGEKEKTSNRQAIFEYAQIYWELAYLKYQTNKNRSLFTPRVNLQLYALGLLDKCFSCGIFCTHPLLFLAISNPCINRESDTLLNEYQAEKEVLVFAPSKVIYNFGSSLTAKRNSLWEKHLIKLKTVSPKAYFYDFVHLGAADNDLFTSTRVFTIFLVCIKNLR
jgi:hypothetical protein